MGLKFGSITNKLAGAYAVADNLGLLKETKKGKSAIKQDPKTVINRAKNKKSVSLTTFPEDIGPKYFHMRFKEYSYNAGKSETGEPNIYTTDVIKLPIPAELEEKYSMDYAQEQMGGIVGGLVEKFGTTPTDMSPEQRQELDAAGIIGENALSGAALTTRQISGFIAGRLGDLVGADGIENAIGIASGVVENPNTRGLFKAVQLREFQFSWRLSPRNANELASIRKIISLIRAKMHPEISELATVPVAFKFPDIVDFGFSGTLRDVPFKPAAIKDIRINMNPEGVPSFFQGVGEPVVYEIAISLMELEQFTREDFE